MNDLHGILITIAQSLPGFLMAIVVHEAAHAWMANRFGDPTAKNQGRLTLNPMVHYDPVGTLFLPIFAIFFNFAVIGWARPVPIETRNFKEYRKGLFWVSFAGPLSNVILGIISAMVLALIATQVSPDWEFYAISLRMLRYSIFINFFLAVFNLIPLPPLDGSKMVSTFLSGHTLRRYEELARFTPLFFIVLFALSYMGVHIFGYLLQPANWLANFFMFSFLSLFGGLG